MRSKLILLIYASIYIIFLWSCASQGRPSGGPRDETPPKKVTNKSTPNLQTNFQKQPIILEFDEFIIVKNALQEIVVSPPLAHLPKVSHRGKKVTFEFHEDETLKREATYSINFGQSIKDFTEGNPTENLTFVFSTGDLIDSLSIRGKVIDAITGEPVNEMLVMLYEDLRDSIPYLERPFYSTRTTKDGSFQINHIKEDTFKVFALKDENVNYLYDIDSEMIGYLDSTVYINTKTIQNEFVIQAFTEDPEPRVTETIEKNIGLAKIVFNKPSKGIPWLLDSTETSIVFVEDKDSLLIFYDSTFQMRGRHLLLQGDSTRMKGFRSSATVPRMSARISTKESKLLSSDSIRIKTYTPIQNIQTDSIMIVDTNMTMLNWSLSFDTMSRTFAISMNELPTEKELTLYLFPGAITDFFDQHNQDTLTYSFSIIPKGATGIIQLNFKQLLLDSINYIFNFQLGKQTLNTIHTMDLTDSVMIFSPLLPGQYRAMIVQDGNKNKKQDKGNYLQRRVPEQEKILTFQPLKPDWTLEADVYWEKPLSTPAADSTSVNKRYDK